MIDSEVPGRRGLYEWLMEEYAGPPEDDELRELWDEWDDGPGFLRERTVTIDASDPLQVVAVKHAHRLSYQQRLMLARLIHEMVTGTGTAD